MIRDLPQGSRYVALLTWQERRGEREDPEPSEERKALEEQHEIRQWSSTDTQLQAATVNVLQNILRYTPQWKKTPPESEVIGPSWWKEKDAKPKRRFLQEEPHGAKGQATEPAKQASVLDAMRAMGFDGPAPQQ